MKHFAAALALVALAAPALAKERVYKVGDKYLTQSQVRDSESGVLVEVAGRGIIMIDEMHPSKDKASPCILDIAAFTDFAARNWDRLSAKDTAPQEVQVQMPTEEGQPVICGGGGTGCVVYAAKVR